MWKAVAIAALAVTFAGAASAQSNLAPPPSASGRSQTDTNPDQSRGAAGQQLRGGTVDLNNNSATGRGRREQGSGTVPQRLGPIAPGTGARDRGPPDSSTYNPSTPAVR